MYATIIDRKIQTHEGAPSLEKMQEVVGGYICTGLRADSLGGRSVDVYCNDEGLYMDLPIDHVRLPDKSPLAGNLIIVVSNARGETVPATFEEIEQVLPFIGRLPVTMTPEDFGF